MNAKINSKDELDELDRYLIGRELDGGWTIVDPRRVQRDHPSVCRAYIAKNRDGRTGFVKVLDNRGTGDLDKSRLEIDRFIYERDVVRKCSERNMRRIVQGIAYGHIEVRGSLSIYLHYLIFEWADSDVRSRAELEGPTHEAHALRWMHHATTAVEELHFSEISHQDIKPANLLIRTTLDAKLGDLGRAIDGSVRRGDLEKYSDATRDLTYAPPEVLYGESLPSLESRFSSDLYQLGSIATFLFTGLGMTTHLMKEIPLMHHWSRWREGYRQVLPYLSAAYDSALDRIAIAIDEPLRSELISTICELCEPDPEKRGYPAAKLGGDPKYSVRQYVSIFNRFVTP